MSEQMRRPDVQAVLGSLKDFQRDTVDYVFRRLYLDPDATRHFLIADEVGLGKTLVARGVIARAVDHLWDQCPRIDVIYICSNGDIARQNINRLRIGDQKDMPPPSRITLLPTMVQNLSHRKLNFIAFTPGTSFQLKSSLGIVEERALLYWLLRDTWQLRGTGALNVLQGKASKDRFRSVAEQFKDDHDIDVPLTKAFVDALGRRAEADRQVGQTDIRSRFEELCDRFGYARKHVPQRDREDRARLVSELRGLLAATCLTALEPDLVILDEFQRFKYLLDGTDEASNLARGLFEFPGARVLLLSATPYKMYTMAHESLEDDHYQDFVRTIRFLQFNGKRDGEFERLLHQFRRGIYSLDDGGSERFPQIKAALEAELRRVMVRTERLAVSQDRDGMLVEVAANGVRMEVRDLESYLALQKVGRLLGQNDTIEYWKSAPYLLNFMEGYELKRALTSAQTDSKLESELATTLPDTGSLLLDWDAVSAYGEIDPANARLRALLAETVDRGAWRLLWIPPSFPYYQLGGPFADPALRRFTKRLLFSCWMVVPKVVATLVSYEAERRMIRSFEEKPENSPEARKKRSPLLRFVRSEDRLTGMPVLGLLYPSMVLARECDPLSLFPRTDDPSPLPTQAEAVDRARRRIEGLLSGILQKPATAGAEDESWYWAAPVLLDLTYSGEAARCWFDLPGLASRWSGPATVGEENGEPSLWTTHVERALELVAGQLALGPRPADLSLVLAQMALAGPGVVALRALARVIGGFSALESPSLRDAAGQIAWGYLRLFNSPEAMALLRGMSGREPYWRRVLEYCVDGGLQSTLDEYAHVLRESLGLLDRSSEDTASEIAASMRRTIALRTVNLGVDELMVVPEEGKVSIGGRRMRASFALRFGEDRVDDSTEINRPGQVREAFNSPFWPFVLATTSVGQEGLDFHPYCHAIVHWNLPSNPVDLEQREGRIHRYKGHAVRRNLALRFGDLIRAESSSDDPWERLFSYARENRSPGSNDLVPYWVFPAEGGARIERHVLALPLSREQERLGALRRSLAIYRMVFGQPRQEDLMAYLLANLPEEQVARVAEELRIDLSPPRALIQINPGGFAPRLAQSPVSFELASDTT